MTHPPEPKATMTNNDNLADQRFTWRAGYHQISNSDD